MWIENHKPDPDISTVTIGFRGPIQNPVILKQLGAVRGGKDRISNEVCCEDPIKYFYTCTIRYVALKID